MDDRSAAAVDDDHDDDEHNARALQTAVAAMTSVFASARDLWPHNQPGTSRNLRISRKRQLAHVKCASQRAASAHLRARVVQSGGGDDKANFAHESRCRRSSSRLRICKQASARFAVKRRRRRHIINRIAKFLPAFASRICIESVCARLAATLAVVVAG